MMKIPIFPLITISLAIFVTSAEGEPPSTNPSADPVPGISKKTTPVKFHENNGFGNGDQDAPGNSGGNNNAENGPGKNADKASTTVAAPTASTGTAEASTATTEPAEAPIVRRAK